MKLQKETNRHGKWYGDACAAAFAMELVGERWSLLIVRELIFGGLRFNDIRTALPGISAKVLAERLSSLEDAGIIVRRRQTAGARVWLYELTKWGEELEQVMRALARWAVKSPSHDPALPLTPVSLMLSLRAMVLTERVGDLDVSILFDVGGTRFRARLKDGDFAVEREIDARAVADMMFCAPGPLDFLKVFYGDEPLESPEHALTVKGDRNLAERVIKCFGLPPKCEPAESPRS